MKKRIFLLLGISLVGACTGTVATSGDFVAPVTRNSLPRDRYEARVAAASDAPRLREWQRAGQRALRERLTVKPSFEEIVRFVPDHAYAIGYRIPLRRGQRVTVELQRIAGGRGEVFAEVFEEIAPPSAMFRPISAPHPDARGFEFESKLDGEYVLRVQPAMDVSGTYRIRVTTAAGLTFPVSEANLKSIGSYFGDSRDGGKRHHEGVDIFAPRGTAVLAAAPGIITEVGTNTLGGRVVWQRDPVREVTYYYAHLQEQHVYEGQRVAAGDKIGTVGNTGNARTTPPHLHFSVYRPGRIALDPVPFLYDQPAEQRAAVAIDTSELGEWTRVSAHGVRLRAAPSTDGRIITELDRETRVLPIGGIRDWERVLLEDGTTGFIAGRLVN